MAVQDRQLVLWCRAHISWQWTFKGDSRESCWPSAWTVHPLPARGSVPGRHRLLQQNPWPSETAQFRREDVREQTNVSSRPSSCFIVTKHWPKPAWGGEGLSGLQVPAHHQRKPEQVLKAGIQRETLLCGVPLQVCLQILAFLISLNIT